MAISNITISQDNIINGSDLLPVDSPVIFLADVTYTGSNPLSLLVDVIDDNSDVIGTFRAIFKTDLLATLRQFSFIANDVMKGLMNGFDDSFQLNNTLVYIEDITKTVTLKFYDPDNELTFDEVTVTFIRGANQFGENPNKDDVYNNDPETYLGPEGGTAYVYFYNNDISNVLTINNPIGFEAIAVGYNDDELVGYNDDQFEIITST